VPTPKAHENHNYRGKILASIVQVMPLFLEGPEEPARLSVYHVGLLIFEAAETLQEPPPQWEEWKP
jgi:hypothetical protein